MTDEQVARLRTMETSDLVFMMTDEDVLMSWAFGQNWESTFADITDRDIGTRIHAACVPLLRAICAEVNRRIPVPM